MSHSSASIGIDIGSSDIKFALCSGGSLKRLAIEPLPDNLLREGRIVSTEAMSIFLREAVKKHRITGRRCAVVLPGAVAFSKTVTMPVMSVEQLQLNLPYEFRDYISLEKDKYFYDYALLEPISEKADSSAQMHLMAAATLKSTIADYSAMLQRAGLKLTSAAPEECAYMSLLRRYQEANHIPPQEYCIIDLGHSATKVHIFSGHRFEVTRVIDYGGAMMDSLLSENMNIDAHIAKNYRLTNYDNLLESEVLLNLYRSVAIEIMRAVNFYGFNNPTSQLKNAYLSGGGALNPFLVEQIRNETSLELHEVTELLPPSAQTLDTPPLATLAYGIAL